MDDFPSLSNPPCVEAIIELRASLAAPAGPDERKVFFERFRERFPAAQDLHFMSAEIRFGDDGPSPETSSSVIGVRLESRDKLWVIQAKSDGLAVSRLAPYEGWDSLLAVVKELWPAYVEIFRAQRVTRLGVRFLNRIDLGSEPVDLDLIFTNGPKVPPSLPQGVLSYRSQVVVPIVELLATLSVSLSSDFIPPVGDGPVRSSVIIDIDASSGFARSIDDPTIWVQLENLRRAKNRAFFGSLQPDALKRYM